MERQTILWTALPNGTATVNGKTVLRLSVYAGLRLYSDAKGPLNLSTYKEVRSWTTRVRDDLSLSVVFENGPTFDATQVVWDKSVLEPDLWEALFSDTIPVKPYAFDDLSGKPILSYSVKNVESFIQSQYTDVAVQYPDHYPEAATLAKKLDVINLMDYDESGKAPAVPHRMTFQQRVSGMSSRVRASVGKTLTALLRVPNAKLRPQAATMLESMAKELDTKQMIMSGAPDAPKDFLQFQMFHASQNEQVNPKMAGVYPANRMDILIPQIDFHEAVSAMGDYPELLKKLGIVIELTVPYSGSLPSGSAVSVVPAWKNPFAITKVDVPSKTALQPGAFQAATKSASSDLKNGLLDLSDKLAFDVVQLDVDGAAFKLMNTAETVRPFLARAQAEKPPVLADAGNVGSLAFVRVPYVSGLIQTEQSLPSLRSTGISIVRANRPAVLLMRVQKYASANQTLKNVEKSPVLLADPKFAATPAKPDELRWYAEDLLRGYRVDVWDSDTKKWHSLCKRKGTYTFTNKASVQREMPDEGIVSMAVTAPLDKSTDDLRLHESLFKWDGWSLSAPRPGKVIDQDDTAKDIKNTPQTPTGLEVHFVPEMGTLPRLRFGTKYRLRARIVDLAGNSRALEEFSDSDFTGSTDEKTYLRFEPISSPAAVLRTPVKPGEGLENVAIRSNYDKTANEYAQAHSLPDPSPERHFVAPRVTQLMAETHGKFDGMTPEATYALITSRDAPLGGANDPSKPENVLITDALVTLPYLPDPLAAGASLTFYDRTGKLIWATKMIDLYPKGARWPSPVSFRLKVVEGTGDPKWEVDGERVLTVQLPKAELVRVRYSSYFTEEQLKVQGLWSWIEDRNPGNKADIHAKALEGKVWMMTPFREMTLVHPVQQPLQEPTFDKFAAIKEKVGATYALIHTRILADGKSSGRVGLQADWTEPVDDLLAPEPGEITGKASVFDITMADTDVNVTSGDPNTPEQKPGGPAMIGFEAVGHTVVPGMIQQEAPKVQGVAKPGEVMMPAPGKLEGVKVPAPAQGKEAAPSMQADAAKKTTVVSEQQMIAPSIKAALELVLPKKHEFGDTKYRKVRYHAVATTRFREYFLDLIFPDRYAPKPTPPKGGLKIPQEETKVDLPLTRETTTEIKVLNSARPAMPVIQYVIPTFEWERKEDNDSIISRRCGGGLRVFIERPWYSSGDEEKLGVVLAADPSLVTQDSDHPLKAFVTQWGLDPIWRSSGSLKLAPSLNDFPEAVIKQNYVTLAELSKVLVHVAAHEVMYDKERRLWFSDITVNSGSVYFPFIRLGLSRFQPNSIADAFISRVTMTDFIQIIPDRTTALTFPEPKTVTVQVAGVFGLNANATAAEVAADPKRLLSSQFMVASLERRATDGDFGWVPVQEHPGYLAALSDLIVPQQQYGAKMVWSGEIELPAPLTKPRGQNGLRIVVKEYELFEGQKGQHVPRMVYVDSIEL